MNEMTIVDCIINVATIMVNRVIRRHVPVDHRMEDIVMEGAKEGGEARERGHKEEQVREVVRAADEGVRVNA